jgi:hypothetical protein
MCTLVLLAATTVLAQTMVVTDQNGRLVRFDTAASVVVLEDGRMFRVTPQTMILVDEKPVALTTLQPGQQVVIRSGEAVMLKDGRYVTTTAAVAAPAAAVVPMNAVKQTIYGKVSDIDKNGQVTVKTAKGAFEVRMSPDAARTVKKGDTVTIDVTIAPPGASPAASPATR